MTIEKFVETVDWCGDGDDDDFFTQIEQIFDLKLRRELPWTTFGEVLDHVDTHIRRHRDATGCASQMTFYRLRRALSLGHTVAPDEALQPHLHGHLGQRFRDLEADTGLVMPRLDFGPRGWLAVALYCLAVVSFFWLGMGGGGLIVAAAISYVAFILKQTDHRRLPRSLSTIGDLARATANLNRGRLATEGARLTRKEIWQIIQELAAAEPSIDPASVGLNTTFFKSTVKAAA